MSLIRQLTPEDIKHHLKKDSSTNVAHFSERIAAWLSAETLTSHGSNHLLVVFNLDTPSKKQDIKPQNPFRYEKTGSEMVSKLHMRKPRKQSRKGSQKSKKQPPWWPDSETEEAWTDKTCHSEIIIKIIITEYLWCPIS